MRIGSGSGCLAAAAPFAVALLADPLVAGRPVGHRLDVAHAGAQAETPGLVEHAVIRRRHVSGAGPTPMVEPNLAAAGPAAQNQEPGIVVIVVAGRAVQGHVPSDDPVLRDDELGPAGTVLSSRHPNGRGGGRHDGGRGGRRRGRGRNDGGRAELPDRAARSRAPNAVHGAANAAAATGNPGDLTHQLVDRGHHRTRGVAEDVRPPLGIQPDVLAAFDGHLRDQAGGRLEPGRALDVVQSDARRQVVAGADHDVTLHDVGAHGHLPEVEDVVVADHRRGDRQCRLRGRERRARGVGSDRRRRHTRGHGGHRGLARRVVRMHRTVRVVDDHCRDRGRAQRADGRDGRGVSGRRVGDRGYRTAQARIRHAIPTEPLTPHRRWGDDDRGASARTAGTTRTALATGSAGASLTTRTRTAGTTRTTVAGVRVVAAVVTVGQLTVGLRPGPIVMDLLSGRAPREGIGDTAVGETIGIRVDAIAVELRTVPDHVRAVGVRLDAGPAIGHDSQLDAHQREVVGERAGDRLYVLRCRRDGGVADRTGLVGRDELRTEVVEALLNLRIVGEAVARVRRVRAHLRAVDLHLDLGAALADLDQGCLDGIPQLLEAIEVEDDDVAGGHSGYRTSTGRTRDGGRRTRRCRIRAAVPGRTASGEHGAQRHECDEQRQEGVAILGHVVRSFHDLGLRVGFECRIRVGCHRSGDLVAIGVDVSGRPPLLRAAAGRRTPLRVLAVLDVRVDDITGRQNPEPGDAPAQEVDDVSDRQASGVEPGLDEQDDGHDDRVCDGAADGSDDVVDTELDQWILHSLISASLAGALMGLNGWMGESGQARLVPHRNISVRYGHCARTWYTIKVGGRTAKAAAPTALAARPPIVDWNIYINK